MRVWCSSSSKACQALGGGAIPPTRFLTDVLADLSVRTSRLKDVNLRMVDSEYLKQPALEIVIPVGNRNSRWKPKFSSSGY